MSKINNDQEYEECLRQISELMWIDEETITVGELVELDRLATLVEEYEDDMEFVIFKE